MSSFFFFQAEDGIRDLVRSRGLGDVYKRQVEFREGLQQGDEIKHRNTAGQIHESGFLGQHHRLSLIHI